MRFSPRGSGNVPGMTHCREDETSSDQPLRESEVPADPIDLFGRWYDEAVQRNTTAWLDPTAMTLATVDAAGQPAARVVLFKGFDACGLVFYTNYESDKGVQLALHPYAALVVYWPHVRRQVRVTGPVMRISRAESVQYFDSRPRGSRVSAIVSPQSRVVADRKVLEAAVRVHDQEGKATVCPDHWGGFRTRPETFEFWQSRASRLHDRLRYVRDGGAGWRLQRLAP